MRTLTLEAKHKGDKYTYILVATDDRHIPVGEADALFAQRIVACVNASEGIPTDALEAGVIEKAMSVRSGIQAIILNIQAAATTNIELDHVDLVARLTDVLGGDDGEK